MHSLAAMSCVSYVIARHSQGKYSVFEEYPLDSTRSDSHMALGQKINWLPLNFMMMCNNMICMIMQLKLQKLKRKKAINDMV